MGLPVSPQSQSPTEGSLDPNIQRNYYCQRCLNHGEKARRKNHKCPFKSVLHSDHCRMCSLVDERRMLNQGIIRGVDDVQDVEIDVETVEDDSGGRIRRPKCARCRVHGRLRDLKGHKRNCQFDNPEHLDSCMPCQLVGKRRHVMARQVKLRRHQAAGSSDSEAGPSKISNPCPSIPVRFTFDHGVVSSSHALFSPTTIANSVMSHPLCHHVSHRPPEAQLIPSMQPCLCFNHSAVLPGPFLPVLQQPSEILVLPCYHHIATTYPGP